MPPAAVEDQLRPLKANAARTGWLGQPYRRFTALCMALTASVAVVDATTGRHIVLIGLLAVGPSSAIVTGRAYQTAAVGLWAILLSVVLAVPDGIWGTRLQLDYTIAVTLTSATSVGIAALIERRRGWVASLALAERDDIDFLVNAYGAVLDRLPDPAGLADQLRELRSGKTRTSVLRAIVHSPEATTLAIHTTGARNLVADFWSRGAEARQAARPLCFLHVMKTAGTSLSHVLIELAGTWPYLADLLVDDLVCLPNAVLTNTMLIAGHLPYEALELLPDNIASCTVVRDPLERTLSHHAHLNTVLADRDLPPVPIEEFVSSPLYHPLWQDYQSRQLVHRVGLSSAWRAYSPVAEAGARGISGPDAAYPLQSLFDSTPLELSGEPLAQAALERLEAVDLVGTTDDLDRLVARVAKFWGRPIPSHVPHDHVSASRLERDTLDSHLVRVIAEGTMADTAVYRQACRIAARP